MSFMQAFWLLILVFLEHSEGAFRTPLTLGRGLTDQPNALLPGKKLVHAIHELTDLIQQSQATNEQHWWDTESSKSRKGGTAFHDELEDGGRDSRHQLYSVEDTTGDVKSPKAHAPDPVEDIARNIATLSELLSSGEELIKRLRELLSDEFVAAWHNCIVALGEILMIDQSLGLLEEAQFGKDVCCVEHQDGGARHSQEMWLQQCVGSHTQKSES